LLPIYFEKSDAFVFPYNEWGNVIASSGALSMVAPYSKPIIATDVPAFASLKNLRVAIIVKKGDVEGLACAIVEALNDNETKNVIESNMRKWLSQSSWENVAKTTAKLYETLKKPRNLEEPREA
jgi:glycosyltransferase involved in cell wall biosynthesis